MFFKPLAEALTYPEVARSWIYCELTWLSCVCLSVALSVCPPHNFWTHCLY